MTAVDGRPRFRGMTAEQVEKQYNPRASVPNFEAQALARDADSVQARVELDGVLDLRFGPNPLEVLDVFRQPSAIAAPVQIYFHGGYWRAQHKENFSFVARPLVAAGAVAVIVSYDLCPDVTLDDIVAEAKRALRWTFENIARYGGDPDRIHISGSSAGAHLCAMLLAHNWSAEGLPADLVKGAVPITGIYDLEPVLHITVNAEIRLDPEMAKRNSPLFLPVHGRPPVLVAVGAAETERWIAESQAYAEHLRRAGVPVTYLESPGDNHFSVTARLRQADNDLVRGMLAQMGLAHA